MYFFYIDKYDIILPSNDERDVKMLDDFKIPNETKKQIYNDLLQPTVSETGKILGRIPRLINAAFLPLDCWIAERQNHLEKTKQLLAENLKDADPEKIVPPEPYVAVPAIQAISYSMDSDELRKMYANLLSKAIYSDTKNSVHPAYTEVVKNLSPLDCRVLEEVMTSQYGEIGCYELRVATVGSSSYHVSYPYVTHITFADPSTVAASIDNLTRNKLIEPKDFSFDDDEKYLPIRQTFFYTTISKTFSSHPNNQELRPYKKSIKSTSFGNAFYNVCCTPL